MTTKQKRQYLKAIAAGSIKHDDFRDIPEMHFTRVSTLANEIIVADYGTCINTSPDTVFVDVENKQHTWEEIVNLAGGRMIWASVSEDPLPFGVVALEVWGLTKEEMIKDFLNNNSK